MILLVEVGTSQGFPDTALVVVHDDAFRLAYNPADIVPSETGRFLKMLCNGVKGEQFPSYMQSVSRAHDGESKASLLLPTVTTTHSAMQCQGISVAQCQ